MKNLLIEIKNLAQKGFEKSILVNDADNKDIFMNIMLKSEVVLNKISENQSQSNKIYTYNMKEDTNRTYEKIDEDTKSKMYLVAYCFSEFEHTILYPDFSQDKAFNVAAENLKIKKNTLKNARDWFDGHNDSHRSGWWQQPLPEDMQRFKDCYTNKSREEIIFEAKNVLGIEESKKNDNPENFGYNLKLTKFHGKFFNKNEVEEFIKIVNSESPTLAKDLVEQCSKNTFKNCYNAFSKIYNNPTDEIKKEIIKYDPMKSTNSDFSLWIRARFIQEIFKRNLQDEVIKICDY